MYLVVIYYRLYSKLYNVISRIEGDMILASLKIHEEKQEEDEDKITHLPSHTLHIGDILAATYVYTSCLLYHAQNSFLQTFHYKYIHFKGSVPSL